MTFLDVFRVLVSPVKAFKEMVEKPDYKGPILILVLTLLATAGGQYITASKVYVESPALSYMRIPSSTPYEINLTFTIPEPSPRNISIFTLNWTNGSDTVTVYGRDTTGEIVDKVTIVENYRAYNTSKAFSAIDRVAFSKTGDNSSQYVMLGMSPGEYDSILAEGVGGLIIPPLMSRAFGFFLDWIIYAIFIHLLLKAFREETGSLGELFIVIGYAFSVMLFYPLIGIPIFSTLSTVHLPLQAQVWRLPTEATEATKKVATDLMTQIYQESWYGAYRFLAFIMYAIDAWMVALFVIAVHFLCEISWKKAIVISVNAYVIRFLLRFFVGI